MGGIVNMSWGKENVEMPFLGVFPLGYNSFIKECVSTAIWG